MLMDVIPLDATLVRGSHGVRPKDLKDHPVLIAQGPAAVGGAIEATDVYHAIKRNVWG